MAGRGQRLHRVPVQRLHPLPTGYTHRVLDKVQDGGKFSKPQKSGNPSFLTRNSIAHPTPGPCRVLTQTWLVDKVPGHGQYVLVLSLSRRNRHFMLLRVPDPEFLQIKRIPWLDDGQEVTRGHRTQAGFDGIHRAATNETHLNST